MMHTLSEIRNQPRLWSKSIELASARLEEVRPYLQGPIALVGAGTSYYVGLAVAAYMEELAGISARAVPASVYTPREYESVILISRSGTTTELLEAARAARGAGVASLGITCEADSPLGLLSDHTVVLDYVKEQSIVQTGSATSAMVLLRAMLDRIYGGGQEVNLVEQVKAALEDPIAAPQELDHLVVLGSGWRYGIACEAALKAQEMAQMWTERYVPLEYRHGPISCAAPQTLVFILDGESAGMGELAADIENTGAVACLAEYDPMVELVRLQSLALHVAQQRGLNPDRPRHLNRSIILSTGAGGVDDHRPGGSGGH